MVNTKNKWTLSPPVGAVSNRTASAQFKTVPTKRQGRFPNRTGLEGLINSKIYYNMQNICSVTRLTLSITLVVMTSSGFFGCAGRISDINIFSDAQEVQLGKQFSGEIEKEMKMYSDPVVTAYIDQLGQHLANHSQRQNITYHFKVVNTEVVNAFAVPGGYLYVNIGLIRAAENESELAGVIGHEIGHVVGKHGVKQMTRQLGLAAVAQLALGENQSKLKQMVAGLAANGVLMKYSRDAEREADIYAVQEMYDAGIDPEGMATFFEKLLKLQKGEPSKLKQMFSTHPPTTERIAAVRSNIAKLPRKSNLKKDSRRFHQIKKRLPPPSKTPKGKR